MEFRPFDKIARLKRECMITEKIDGTNAQVCIEHLALVEGPGGLDQGAIAHNADFAMFAGSRTQWITPEKDNFGFARWVKEHCDELWSLGPGSHYGEWWGPGIQRGYGLKEKKFSLFNAFRWNSENPGRPACCDVVPILHKGEFGPDIAQACIEDLRTNGSKAAPGFQKPEGIVIYLSAARSYFKQTLEKDDKPKGSQE